MTENKKPSRITQTIAVTLVMALVLTMPGATAWADGPGDGAPVVQDNNLPSKVAVTAGPNGGPTVYSPMSLPGSNSMTFQTAMLNAAIPNLAAAMRIQNATGLSLLGTTAAAVATAVNRRPDLQEYEASSAGAVPVQMDNLGLATDVASAGLLAAAVGSSGATPVQKSLDAVIDSLQGVAPRTTSGGANSSAVTSGANDGSSPDSGVEDGIAARSVKQRQSTPSLSMADQIASMLYGSQKDPKTGATTIGTAANPVGGISQTIKSTVGLATGTYTTLRIKNEQLKMQAKAIEAVIAMLRAQSGGSDGIAGAIIKAKSDLAQADWDLANAQAAQDDGAIAKAMNAKNTASEILLKMEQVARQAVKKAEETSTGPFYKVKLTVPKGSEAVAGMKQAIADLQKALAAVQKMAGDVQKQSDQAKSYIDQKHQQFGADVPTSDSLEAQVQKIIGPQQANFQKAIAQAQQAEIQNGIQNNPLDGKRVWGQTLTKTGETVGTVGLVAGVGTWAAGAGAFGTAAAAFIASNPIGWGVGALLVVGAGAYALGTWLSHQDDQVQQAISLEDAQKQQAQFDAKMNTLASTPDLTQDPAYKSAIQDLQAYKNASAANDAAQQKLRDANDKLAGAVLGDIQSGQFDKTLTNMEALKKVLLADYGHVNKVLQELRDYRNGKKGLRWDALSTTAKHLLNTYGANAAKHAGEDVIDRDLRLTKTAYTNNKKFLTKYFAQKGQNGATQDGLAVAAYNAQQTASDASLNFETTKAIIYEHAVNNSDYRLVNYLGMPTYSSDGTHFASYAQMMQYAKVGGAYTLDQISQAYHNGFNEAELQAQSFVGLGQQWAAAGEQIRENGFSIENAGVVGRALSATGGLTLGIAARAKSPWLAVIGAAASAAGATATGIDSIANNESFLGGFGSGLKSTASGFLITAPFKLGFLPKLLTPAGDAIAGVSWAGKLSDAIGAASAKLGDWGGALWNGFKNAAPSVFQFAGDFAKAGKPYFAALGRAARWATFPGRFVGDVVAPLVPLSLSAYGAQTVGDGSFSFTGDPTTGNIGLLGALTRPSSLIWGAAKNGLDGAAESIGSPAFSALASVGDYFIDANRITTDVKLFAAGGGLTGDLAEGLLGKGLLSQSASQIAMQLPMVQFYQSQIEAFKSAWNGKSSWSDFALGLSSMALGVVGAHGSVVDDFRMARDLKSTDSAVQQKASEYFSGLGKSLATEMVKLGTIAGLGSIPGLQNIVAFGSALAPTALQLANQANSVRDQAALNIGALEDVHTEVLDVAAQRFVGRVNDVNGVITLDGKAIDGLADNAAIQRALEMQRENEQPSAQNSTSTPTFAESLKNAQDAYDMALANYEETGTPEAAAVLTDAQKSLQNLYQQSMLMTQLSSPGNTKALQGIVSLAQAIEDKNRQMMIEKTAQELIAAAEQRGETLSETDAMAAAKGKVMLAELTGMWDAKQAPAPEVAAKLTLSQDEASKIVDQLRDQYMQRASNAMQDNGVLAKAAKKSQDVIDRMTDEERAALRQQILDTFKTRFDEAGQKDAITQALTGDNIGIQAAVGLGKTGIAWFTILGDALAHGIIDTDMLVKGAEEGAKFGPDSTEAIISTVTFKDLLETIAKEKGIDLKIHDMDAIVEKMRHGSAEEKQQGLAEFKAAMADESGLRIWTNDAEGHNRTNSLSPETSQEVFDALHQANQRINRKVISDEAHFKFGESLSYIESKGASPLEDKQAANFNSLFDKVAQAVGYSTKDNVFGSFDAEGAKILRLTSQDFDLSKGSIEKQFNQRARKEAVYFVDERGNVKAISGLATKLFDAMGVNQSGRGEAERILSGIEVRARYTTGKSNDGKMALAPISSQSGEGQADQVLSDPLHAMAIARANGHSAEKATEFVRKSVTDRSSAGLQSFVGKSKVIVMSGSLSDVQPGVEALLGKGVVQTFGENKDVLRASHDSTKAAPAKIYDNKQVLADAEARRMVRNIVAGKDGSLRADWRRQVFISEDPEVRNLVIEKINDLLKSNEAVMKALQQAVHDSLSLRLSENEKAIIAEALGKTSFAEIEATDLDPKNFLVQAYDASAKKADGLFAKYGSAFVVASDSRGGTGVDYKGHIDLTTTKGHTQDLGRVDRFDRQQYSRRVVSVQPDIEQGLQALALAEVRQALLKAAAARGEAFVDGEHRLTGAGVLQKLDWHKGDLSQLSDAEKQRLLAWKGAMDQSSQGLISNSIDLVRHTDSLQPLMLLQRSPRLNGPDASSPEIRDAISETLNKLFNRDFYSPSAKETLSSDLSLGTDQMRERLEAFQKESLQALDDLQAQLKGIKGRNAADFRTAIDAMKAEFSQLDTSGENVDLEGSLLSSKTLQDKINVLMGRAETVTPSIGGTLVGTARSVLMAESHAAIDEKIQNGEEVSTAELEQMQRLARGRIAENPAAAKDPYYALIASAPDLQSVAKVLGVSPNGTKPQSPWGSAISSLPGRIYEFKAYYSAKVQSAPQQGFLSKVGGVVYALANAFGNGGLSNAQQTTAAAATLAILSNPSASSSDGMAPIALSNLEGLAQFNGQAAGAILTDQFIEDTSLKAGDAAKDVTAELQRIRAIAATAAPKQVSFMGVLLAGVTKGVGYRRDAPGIRVTSFDSPEAGLAVTQTLQHAELTGKPAQIVIALKAARENPQAVKALQAAAPKNVTVVVKRSFVNPLQLPASVVASVSRVFGGASLPSLGAKEFSNAHQQYQSMVTFASSQQEKAKTLTAQLQNKNLSSKQRAEIQAQLDQAGSMAGYLKNHIASLKQQRDVALHTIQLSAPAYAKAASLGLLPGVSPEQQKIYEALPAASHSAEETAKILDAHLQPADQEVVARIGSALVPSALPGKGVRLPVNSAGLPQQIAASAAAMARQDLQTNLTKAFKKVSGVSKKDKAAAVEAALKQFDERIASQPPQSLQDIADIAVTLYHAILNPSATTLAPPAALSAQVDAKADVQAELTRIQKTAAAQVAAPESRAQAVAALTQMAQDNPSVVVQTLTDSKIHEFVLKMVDAKADVQAELTRIQKTAAANLASQPVVTATDPHQAEKAAYVAQLEQKVVLPFVQKLKEVTASAAESVKKTAEDRPEVAPLIVLVKAETLSSDMRTSMESQIRALLGDKGIGLPIRVVTAAEDQTYQSAAKEARQTIRDERAQALGAGLNDRPAFTTPNKLVTTLTTAGTSAVLLLMALHVLPLTVAGIGIGLGASTVLTMVGQKYGVKDASPAKGIKDLLSLEAMKKMTEPRVVYSIPKAVQTGITLAAPVAVAAVASLMTGGLNLAFTGAAVMGAKLGVGLLDLVVGAVKHIVSNRTKIQAGGPDPVSQPTFSTTEQGAAASAAEMIKPAKASRIDRQTAIELKDLSENPSEVTVVHLKPADVRGAIRKAVAQSSFKPANRISTMKDLRAFIQSIEASQPEAAKALEQTAAQEIAKQVRVARKSPAVVVVLSDHKVNSDDAAAIRQAVGAKVSPSSKVVVTGASQWSTVQNKFAPAASAQWTTTRLSAKDVLGDEHPDAVAQNGGRMVPKDERTPLLANARLIAAPKRITMKVMAGILGILTLFGVIGVNHEAAVLPDLRQPPAISSPVVPRLASASAKPPVQDTGNTMKNIVARSEQTQADHQSRVDQQLAPLQGQFLQAEIRKTGIADGVRYTVHQADLQGVAPSYQFMKGKTLHIVIDPNGSLSSDGLRQEIIAHEIFEHRITNQLRVQGVDEAKAKQIAHTTAWVLQMKDKNFTGQDGVAVTKVQRHLLRAVTNEQLPAILVEDRTSHHEGIRQAKAALAVLHYPEITEADIQAAQQAFQDAVQDDIQKNRRGSAPNGAAVSSPASPASASPQKVTVNPLVALFAPKAAHLSAGVSSAASVIRSGSPAQAQIARDWIVNLIASDPRAAVTVSQTLRRELQATDTASPAHQTIQALQQQAFVIARAPYSGMQISQDGEDVTLTLGKHLTTEGVANALQIAQIVGQDKQLALHVYADQELARFLDAKSGEIRSSDAVKAAEHDQLIHLKALVDSGDIVPSLVAPRAAMPLISRLAVVFTAVPLLISLAGSLFQFAPQLLAASPAAVTIQHWANPALLLGIAIGSFALIIGRAGAPETKPASPRLLDSAFGSAA